VRGWPRQLSDEDHDRIAEAIVKYLELCRYAITRDEHPIKPSPKWAGRG
jgi:hypothetical protein